MKSEKYIRLSEAAKLSPGRPSAAAIWRWSRKGLKSRSGQRVYLRHIRVGGKIFTTAEFLYQFFADVAEADVAHFDNNNEPTKYTRKKKKRSKGLREHEINRAKTELEEAKI